MCCSLKLSTGDQRFPYRTNVKKNGDIVALHVNGHLHMQQPASTFVWKL